MSSINPEVKGIYRMEANNLIEQFDTTMDSKKEERLITLLENALIKAYYEGRESILSLGDE